MDFLLKCMKVLQLQFLSQGHRSLFDSAIGGELFSSEDESMDKPDKLVFVIEKKLYILFFLLCFVFLFLFHHVMALKF